MDPSEQQMTLRDQFALQSMQRVMNMVEHQTPDQLVELCEREGLKQPYKLEVLVARITYQIADAMLAERERKT